AQRKGMNVTQIGIVFGVFELVMFIFAPILGKYMCVIGSKFMFISGLFITAGTSILFGFLNLLDTGPMFFGYSLAIRCVEAIGDAAFLTSSFAISAYTFPGRIATVVGILETFGGLGFTAGPAVGGLLFELGGYQLPFIVLGALLGVAAVLSYFLLESPIDQEMKNTQGMMSLLRIPLILLLVLAVVVCAMSLAFIDPTLADHLDSFNLSPVLVGLMFLWCGGIYTITAPLWGYLIDRYNCAPSLMVFGAILAVFGMFFIGPPPFLGIEKSLFSIAAALVVLGIAIGALYIPTFQACLDTVKENGFPDNFETYGCVSGLFQSAFSFGGFFGPTVGGFAVELIGFEWTTTIIAGIHFLVALPLIAYNFISYRRRKKAKKTQPVMPVLSAPLLDTSGV
uniref:Major facilitator superfamily (MFS) profile domain-containing protein n=2 Tax=Plectus sambesii TaxID=2011161 RepID=A0A914X2N0_9BILA